MENPHFVVRQRQLENKRWQWHDKWGIESCNNQIAKKSSTHSHEAESAAAQQLSSWWSTKRKRGGSNTK